MKGTSNSQAGGGGGGCQGSSKDVARTVTVCAGCGSSQVLGLLIGLRGVCSTLQRGVFGSVLLLLCQCQNDGAYFQAANPTHLTPVHPLPAGSLTAPPLLAHSLPSPRGAAFAPAPAPEAIATPEQLQQYLSSLDDRQQSPAGAGAGAGAVQDPWYVSGYGAGGDVYGFPGMAALTQDQTGEARGEGWGLGGTGKVCWEGKGGRGMRRESGRG